VAVLGAWVAGVALVAQSPAPGGATAGGIQVVPRTSWGDPDLQGNFTNTYEYGTPFERPKEFEGRSLEEVTREELVEIRRGIEQRTINAFLGPIHAPEHWWQDNLDLHRGSQAWFVVDPADGRIPPLTEQARTRNAERAAARKNSGRGPADSYTDRSLYDRCITRGLPGSMLPAIYGNQFKIVQAPGSVAIMYEMIHETRVIPLDGRAFAGAAIDQDMGDARGRWEGDTLVIETRNFKERSVYRVTVNDPSTWTAPWTFSIPLTRDDVAFPQYECHEGNYGLRNILSAARAEEEREAAGR
jgi:hypothetical protein